MRVKGFTLIEMLIYSVMSGVIVFSLSLVLALILNARAKNVVIAEVEQQGQFVSSVLEQSIRNAEGVNSPSSGASGTSLDLDVVTVADDPTVYAVSSSVLQITEGTGSAVDLTSDSVEISAFAVEHLLGDNGFGSVQYAFTITHVNPDSRNSFDYAQSFQGTATLRQ